MENFTCPECGCTQVNFLTMLYETGNALQCRECGCQGTMEEFLEGDIAQEELSEEN